MKSRHVYAYPRWAEPIVLTIEFSVWLLAATLTVVAYLALLIIKGAGSDRVLVSVASRSGPCTPSERRPNLARSCRINLAQTTRT